MNNPFRKSEEVKERLKLFLYGDTGAGKTYLSLQFPAPAVIDLEKGSTAYSRTFQFDVIPATTLREIEEGIKFLATEKHDYKTLILDPMTMIYELFQDKWNNIFLKKNRDGVGHKGDFYIFQPGDWKVIKDDWKAFIRRVLMLDMNIICIAREKPLYADDKFMKKIGETYDTDKGTAYYFDTVIRAVNVGGKRIGQVVKDRNSKLGAETIGLDYSIFEKCYSGINADVETVPAPGLSEEDIKALYAAAKLCGYTSKEDTLKGINALLKEEITHVGQLSREKYNFVISELKSLEKKEAA